MNEVDCPEYWRKRYLQNQIAWDCGQITPPLKEYIDQLVNKDIKIIIPGCGNAYEGQYLWTNGFKNVYLLDFATEAIENFKKLVPEFPNQNIIEQNFFDHFDKYDLILEQTFFCAIYPTKRKDYVEHTYGLLNDGGKLVGVLFDREFDQGPPFGGCHKEYKNLFSTNYTKVSISPCYNSVKPRIGTELFIRLEK